MPVEASASIRVNVPDLKAEIEIECLPHNSFWYLKLCLVDGILAKERDDAQSSSRSLQSATATTTTVDRQKKPLMQLVANSLKGRILDKTGTKSCMLSTTPQNSKTSCSFIDRGRQSNNVAPIPSHSSASSLSSTDTPNGSALVASACRTVQQRNNADTLGTQRKNASSPAFYYGFSGLAQSQWEGDDARDSSDLTAEESAAIRALVIATGDSNGYAGSDSVSANGNYNECSNTSSCQHDDQSNNRRISDLLELDERNDDEYNIYESLRFGKLTYEDQSCESKFGDSGTSSVHKASDDDNCDRIDELDGKTAAATIDRRLFEQVLLSGYLNYGFYSFSLARFIDDQTSLTEYLTLVSSSTGASYYLDLEFKLKQRPQIGPLNPRSAYALNSSGNAHHALHLTTTSLSTNSRINIVNRLIHCNSNNKGIDYSSTISLKLNRLSSLSASHCGIKRTNSVSTIGTNESRVSRSSSTNNSDHQHHSFTNNMIAKLASTNGGGSSQRSSSASLATKNSYASSASSSSQCKRKRAKMLDLLLNTNWSKQSQQASNLLKLNKVLLVCDANFLDEKTGESPLSLAITSSQINPTATTSRIQPGNGQAPNTIGCPQSASLFNLQFQHPTTSHSQLTLQQTSAADISQSKAPLVEKILLLLIKSGALIDFRNNDGRTPLHCAAMRSNFWALRTLLDLGASTDYRDIDGLTPLYYSVLHRAELKVTQLLLYHMSNNSPSTDPPGNGSQGRNGKRTIGVSDQQGWQEVHHACKLGLDAHLDKLLYHGCDINAKISGSGNTPLHVAAINDQLQAAKVLLLRGADRTITNNSHQTAHQVAVISNNMDLAEFIASHDEAKVVPFAERPNNRHSFVSATPYTVNGTAKQSNRFSIPPNQLVISHSSSQIALQGQNHQALCTPTGIVKPRQMTELQSKNLNPLTLDVANHHYNANGSAGSSAPSTGTSVSGTIGHQTAQSSLLSINSSSQNQHLNMQANNISPCLSQRSCGTSNTTSSGVCCDGEGNISDTVCNSKNLKSNVTIISISNNANSINRASAETHHLPQYNGEIDPPPPLDFASDGTMNLGIEGDSINQNDDEDEPSSSESSSNELYSLMSNNRPLFAGSIVEAISDYQSGDPMHLQLRREDLIEVLEYPADLLQGGQLPRLANKPMLFGRRRTDGLSGLFPSFCVRRTKLRQSSLRQRIPMADLTNSSSHYLPTSQSKQQATAFDSTKRLANEHQTDQAIRGTNLPESQSMAAIDGHDCLQQGKVLSNDSNPNQQPQQQQTRLSFREYQVTLTKINEGFGFVLRGARINPATLSNQSNGSTGKVAIDERLMVANNLASLQYLDDIEMGSVAQEAGLKRGDFLIAVNSQDVRLCSHENVVQMIRNSGDRVQLTIASPIALQSNHPVGLYSNKTLTRVKPEPPKRDPTTTLTRNKSQKIKSLSVAPQVQGQHINLSMQREFPFDADKPLPRAPDGQVASLSGTLNSMNRSISANVSQLNSISSLATAAIDTQSITSISTVESTSEQRDSRTATPLSHSSRQNIDQSSSSTATLTTVATTKPRAPVKPSSYNLNSAAIKNSPTQPTYQPAAIVISNLTQSGPGNPNITQPNTVQPGEIANPDQLPAPLLPPPPPPPLPNFSSNHYEGSRLTSRRTSAPINQALSLSNDTRLLTKRDSLASVSMEKHTNGPAPICAVAAACAAAANSRLQRQQQKQKDVEQKPVEQKPECTAKEGQKIDSVGSEVPIENIEASEATELTKIDLTVTKKTAQKVGDTQPSIKKITEENREVEQDLNVQEMAANQKRTHLIQSATLGRKSSAQIIQQPKQNTCASHSQTLRAVAAPKRMSILDYEMPPPPLPPPMQRQQIPTGQRSQHPQHPELRQPQSNHRHHNYDGTGVHCAHHMIDCHSTVNRSQNEHAQLQLQNQHQLILRQQQQIRQQVMQEHFQAQQLHIRQQQIMQERLKAQQQVQKQRVCQHIHNHPVSQEYSMGHSYHSSEGAPARHMHQYHHHHNHRQQQQNLLEAQKYHMGQQHSLHSHDIETTPAIEQQLYKHNHSQHTHHHHNHIRQVYPTQHHG